MIRPRPLSLPAATLRQGFGLPERASASSGSRPVFRRPEGRDGSCPEKRGVWDPRLDELGNVIDHVMHAIAVY